MKAVITGGAGFIGSHLADSLLELDYEVMVIDDLSLGKMENIAHLAEKSSFSFKKLDVNEEEKLIEIFKKYQPEVVFHLAANSDIQKGAKYLEVDLNKTFLTTFHTLSAMKAVGIKNIIFSSTSAVYGELQEKLHEDIGPLFPISFYGAAKLSSEAYISAFVENFDMKAWIFRFPNVVGERATHGAMYDFIEKLNKDPQKLKILGDGTQEKPYVYVKDLVAGIIFGWQNSKAKINYFNLGTDSATKVSEIGKIVAEEMRLKDVQFQFTGGDRGWVGDVPKFNYDLGKINKLGWRAERTSSEALRLAVQEELKNRKK